MAFGWTLESFGSCEHRGDYGYVACIDVPSRIGSDKLKDESHAYGHPSSGRLQTPAARIAQTTTFGIRSSLMLAWHLS
jgi:hypothetical protein